MSTTHYVDNLSNWFLKHARALPWRERSDAYGIWVSEAMLQQTQVTTVLPYYGKFLRRFPTLPSLAKADEAEVLRLWSGLGYYRRAKYLHLGAKHVLNHHHGVVPEDREALLKVPGVGAYTAGAILSIAFDKKEALVDGNIARVFTRFYALTESLSSPVVQRKLWEKASEWVNQASSPRILNQALMELGATVCTKKTPDCSRCPIQSGCVAHKRHWQHKLPRRETWQPSKQLRWVLLLFSNRGRLFLRPNPLRGWWAGLWDFPRLEVGKGDTMDTVCHSYVARLKGVQTWESLGSTVHSVTHHRIHAVPYLVKLKVQSAVPEHRGKWFPVEACVTLPTSSLVRKALRILPRLG